MGERQANVLLELAAWDDDAKLPLINTRLRDFAGGLVAVPSGDRRCDRVRRDGAREVTRVVIDGAARAHVLIDWLIDLAA